MRIETGPAASLDRYSALRYTTFVILVENSMRELSYRDPQLNGDIEKTIS